MTSRTKKLEEIYRKAKDRRIVLTKEEFASALGYSRSHFHRIQNSDELITDELLEAADALLQETENVLNEDTSNNYLKNRRNLKNLQNPETLMYYEVGAHAGLQHSSEILPVKKNEGSLHISDLFKGSDYAIRVSGNSMTPNYPSGCIIGIREIPDKLIIPGSVYVIEKDSDLLIKRLFYKDDDRTSGEFECVSDNTMRSESGSRAGKLYYPSFYLKIDEVRKLFKVTGIYKANELTVIT